MFSLRRFTIYVALAAGFLFLTFFREPIVTRARTQYGSAQRASHASSKIGSQPPAAPPVWGEHFRWDQVPVRNPVKSLVPLPSAAPKSLPKVQHKFPKENPQHREVRTQRLAEVKATFERCWNAYREHSWMRDELAPLTGGSRDGFGGWAANLVDNLDNLWIMGMKDEFEDAVKAAVEIDLTTTTLEQVNVFETTIRHLGGLLSAYDLSGDERLLHKAREFGDMLLVAFDTPNRMPITRWDPQRGISGDQEADEKVLVAEIGSLSMEFTHLSQLTADPKWYDAVDRITRLFDKQQFKTYLPGMWPMIVNAKEAIFTRNSDFTLGAMSDSLYEYFPKMHALLGGVDPVYKKLYDGSMATAIKYNLFRPMVPNNTDILMSGGVRATSISRVKVDAKGQHLVCFAGGMFALGGKLFNQPSHVEIGQKLTDGCIWSYRALPLGIMPEVFRMLPCESRLECKWDEVAWKKAIRDNAASGQKVDVDELIRERRLPPGFTEISDRRYILRPEAIESVFLLYRITGEHYLEEAAWDMFCSIVNATRTPLAHAALSDITYSREEMAARELNIQMDSMESFWMAETLKYFYLIFSEPDVIDLDEWVFNTEAHPFRRRLPS